MKGFFRKFSDWASNATGTAWAFAIAVAVVVSWAITGPVFGFSDTWQLVINTGTTIVTFLMVFLIQSTQNRDNSALHAKLDELIVHTRGAHNQLATAEDFTEEQLAELKEHFTARAEQGGTDASDRLSTFPNGAKKKHASGGTKPRTRPRSKTKTASR